MLLIRFINQIKQNSLARKKYFYFKKIKKLNPIIKKFIELNLIKSESLSTQKNIIKVYPCYKHNTVFYKNIKILYRKSAPNYVTLKTLKTLKNYKYNSVYLLSTNTGYLTNYEAIQNNVGGVLICKFLY